MERKIDTNPKLAMKQPQGDFSAQTDLIATTSLPPVALLENSQLNLTLKLTTYSPPGTLSREKKKGNTTDSNYCKKCSVQYGSKIGSDNSLVWINSNAKNCKYWVHLYYTGLSCKDEMKKCLLKSQYMIVKDITPIKSFGQSMS